MQKGSTQCPASRAGRMGQGRPRQQGKEAGKGECAGTDSRKGEEGGGCVRAAAAAAGHVDESHHTSHHITSQQSTSTCTIGIGPSIQPVHWFASAV